MPEPYSKNSLDLMTLQHLSFRLNLPLVELQEVTEYVESRYGCWTKPKKNGGFREISAPKPRLKKIQRAIHVLLKEIKIQDSAHCGIKKRSNLSNAGLHCGNKYLLSLDFEHCFPNISHNRIYHLFRHELNCSPEVSSLLTRICTLRSQVPQGGPMSMDIANLVCRKLDTRLEGLAVRYSITYTRHCDDLNFSGESIPKSFIDKVKKIIVQCGFILNPKKECLRGRHQPQIVTGLLVNQKRPSVSRKVKREWRKEKHIFDKYDSAKLPKALRLKKHQQIQGRITYLNYIKRENQHQTLG